MARARALPSLTFPAFGAGCWASWDIPAMNPLLLPLPQIIENCPVTGIQVRADDFGVKRVHAVETAHGTIQTPCVVNCAGTGRLVEPLCLVPHGLGCRGAAPSPVPLPPPMGSVSPQGCGRVPWASWRASTCRWWRCITPTW